LDTWDDGLWQRFLPRDLRGKVVLDVGAGDCRLYKFLKDKGISKYIACDISEEMLRRCKGANEKILCDLNKSWPIEDESIDVILAFFVLLHIQNLDNFFAEAYRVLKSDGRLIAIHHIERRPQIFKINNKEFKIENYNRRYDEIEKIAEYNFFKIDSFDIPNGGGKVYVFEK
jgi:ubiquinone/menaquinone biosynthesis C-methylase UbiE